MKRENVSVEEFNQNLSSYHFQLTTDLLNFELYYTLMKDNSDPGNGADGNNMKHIQTSTVPLTP